MQIAILGPLEVCDAAGRPVEVGGARLRCLLTRLAVDAARPVPVPVLVDAVWGDQPPADEANALQTLVSRLRRALGDPRAIAQSGAGYRLAVEPDDVDAHRFERLAADGSAALRGGETRRAARLLAEALALWRGPALADAPGAALVAAAARLDDLRLAAHVDRVEADLADGIPGLVPELETLAAAHPLHERLAGQLLRALGASGRQAEALQAYERLRARLADELGVDPSADLQDIHLALLRGEVGAPATGAVRRTNLKAQLTSFVGRDDEVARIGKALEQNRLVTLVGPGGAGKTRLAAEAAAGIVDAAPDGVWLVELASVTDGADVAQTVLGSLGLRETHLLDRRSQLSPRDAMGRLIEGLADKDALVILDNCEHLVEASARVADVLLGACPRLRVLTTSREPLAITGEVLLAVPPLGRPSPDATASVAMDYPAVRLFADRAAAVRPEFAVDDESVAAVVEIVRRLDGMPLAIELAAARLRSLPLAEIAARLSDRFRLLTGGSRTALPRHRTLRAVVEWSWDLLTPAERVLAERLAVFPAGATTAGATAVCADERVLPEELPDLLASLVDKSLLAPVAGGDRLRMLETIREYGVERLAERAELGTVRSRHAHYFADLVAEADNHLRTREQLRWMRLLEAERDNLLAALRFLVDDGQAPPALDLACRLGWYWMFTGAQAEAASWLRFALAGADGAHPDAVLLAEAMLSVTSDFAAAPGEDQAEAFAQLPGMLARFHTADVQRYPMLALMRPIVAMFSGDDAAMAHAVETARHSANPWIAASAQMLMANIAENDGDVATMRSSAAAARVAFEQLGERWGLASCLQIVGLLQTTDGELDEAAATYHEALQLVDELGAHDDAAWLRLRLADVLVRQGRLDAASEQAELASELSEASGSVREAVFGRVVAADIARRTGDVATSRELLQGALDRLTAMPPAHPMASHGLAVGLAIAGKHDLLDGDLDSAADHLERAYGKAIGTRDMPIVATVGAISALQAELLDRPDDAAERLGAATRLRGTPDETHPDVAELTARLRDRLGDAEFDAAFARGRALDRDDAIARLSPSVGSSPSAR